MTCSIAKGFVHISPIIIIVAYQWAETTSSVEMICVRMIFFQAQWSNSAKMNNKTFVNEPDDDACRLECGKPTNNNGFLPKNDDSRGVNSNEAFCMESTDTMVSSTKSEAKRDNWGNSIEFLMSCIAMSVGLGNVWRFPFTALENGGATFLLPYLVVLFIIGRPLYFLEMVIGQFSSRNSIDVYDLSPIFRGIIRELSWILHWNQLNLL